VNNATSMTVSDGSRTLASGPLPSGSVSTGPLNTTTTFTLSVSNSAGQLQNTVLVTVSANAPTVQLSATPNPVPAGGIVNISWTTTNATSITITPSIPNEEGELEVQNPPPGTAIPVNQTTTYVATVTGAGGLTATATLTITVLPPAPSLDFTANPTSIVPGGAGCSQSAPTAPGVTLSWNALNTTSLTITDSAGNSVPGAPPGTLPQGSTSVNPPSTTTYTATAFGGAGQTATATATVTVTKLIANPPSVPPNQASMLCWNFPDPGVVSVNLDHGLGDFPGAFGATSTGNLTKDTTFTATAKDIGGKTVATAKATVTVSGLQSRIKHIIFFVQENRSFDNYFGKLGDYRASKGLPPEIDQFDPNVKLVGIEGREVSPFHQRTVCTDNLSPAWNESHADIHLKNGKYLMDGFMKQTKSIHKPDGVEKRDPNGDRAMGYYDQTDLPYYYELATQFATSDRWFSPVLTNTVNNRYYLFAGTSFGHVNAGDKKPEGGWPQPTIFELMTHNKIRWKYYYIDDVFYAAHFAGWNEKDDKGNFVNQKVRRVGTPGVVNPGGEDLFTILADPKADQLLPSVAFIESGSGGSGLDEHPLNNIQRGAAFTKQIIDALMRSTAWPSSVFIWTFDEGGGLYDHVPPVPMPHPDGIKPILQPGQAVDDFDKSAFRVPLIVVSPWVKPNFVSHQPRDFTAILKLIEDRFGLPPLTKRDAGQISMEEFFDFSAPARLTAPNGANWADVLPSQPDVLGRKCDVSTDFPLETAP
jgi:phospholipase C